MYTKSYIPWRDRETRQRTDRQTDRENHRPGTLAYTSNSRTWRQTDQKFKVILNYIVNLTPVKNFTFFPSL